MNNWFECKVKYKKIDDQGNEKNAVETYLLDAVSFTEAEARVLKVLEQYISGEFKVTRIVPSNISEIVTTEDGEYFYKAKIAMVTLDDQSGKEKHASQYMLVEADNIKQGIERLEKSLETVIVPWDIKEIKESPIFEVFPYFEEN